METKLSEYLFRKPVDDNDGVRTCELLPATRYRRRQAKLLGIENVRHDLASIAKQYHSTLIQSSPPINLYRFDQALVLGQGAVVTRSGALIYDTVAQEINQGYVPAGFQLTEGDIYQCSRPTREIAGTVLLVKTTYDKNYGHWVFQGATILALMSEYLQRHQTPLVMSIGGGTRLAEIKSEIVFDLCGECSVIEHEDGESVEAEHLLYVSPLHGPPLRKQPQTFHFLREFYLRKAYPGHPSIARFVTTGRRLYLARRSYLNRQLANQEELEGLLAEMGFESFFAEDHTHLAQVRAFAEAEIVVGVKGAALANILFSSSQCRVIVLSPPKFLDPFFWDIAGQLGLEYTEIFGTNTASGFFIDLSVMSAAIHE